jgi:hypothetical protein
MEKRLGYRFIDRLAPGRKHPSVTAFTRLSDEGSCDFCARVIGMGEPTFRLRQGGVAHEVCETCVRSLHVGYKAA